MAFIANVTMIIYTVRMGGPNADVSYSVAWQGSWAYVEVSLGLIVTCPLTLPRFNEAEGRRRCPSISGPLSRLSRSTPSPNNDAAIHYPRLGTELDPDTGHRSFEALREVESWTNDSVNDIH